MSYRGRVRLFGRSVVVALASVACCLGVGASFGEERPLRESRPVPGRVEISAPVTPFVFDGDLRDLPTPRAWRPGDPVREIPRRFYPPTGSHAPVGAANQGLDPLLGRQTLAPQLVDPSFTNPDRNFPGQGFSGVNPPDTVGDVGPHHYIQMINSGSGATVNVYDKATPTPNVLATFTLDTLATGGSCAAGLGDPIVLYDRFADRWMLSEFSSSGNNLCVYISQTADPISGGWFAYAFTAPSFPDYPKYGVWPTDGNGGMGSYVITTNESGSGIYAVERGKMLAGQPVTFQRFVIADLPGFGFNAVTPADLDGPNPPPSQAPAIIMRHRDTEVHSGPAAPADLLEMWDYQVDWIAPANTTLTQQPSIDVAEFESDLCGLVSFNCFPQPGTGTTLDPLREVIMNRLQYQNFGDYEVLVGNYVVDVDGTDHGGLRWFELRRSGAGWSLEQEGTYSPDADHRFMAASAMDQSGNIAIAYNVSSTSTFPSLRYTGRLADDAAGTLSQPETDIHVGTASNASNRYGDYSAMNLDPADDCTFWFTGMDNTSSSWRTQITSFRFDACGCELVPLPLTLAGFPNGDNRVDLTWDDSELETVVEYRVRRSRTPGGPYQTIATLADSSPGAGNGNGYAYSDETVSGGITYYYVVQASDGAACTSDPSNEISAAATGICLLEPIFAGLQTVTTPNSAICSLALSWNAATAECGGPVHYEIYRSTTPGFLPDPLSLLEPFVTTTSYLDSDVLVDGTPYYYIVRAVDDANGVGETNTAEKSAAPFGELQPALFVDDAGDDSPAQMTLGAPWQIAGSGGNLGPLTYTTGTYGNDQCVHLVSPPVMLGFDNALEFASRYDIENSYDKGLVQISTDGGTNWTRLEVGYPGTSTNATDACGFPTGTYFTGSDASWQTYSADLSPWDGMSVLFRFSFSSDGSVTRSGWFVDDIAVVNRPATCATASSCADNPLVDVLPNGPLDACVLSIPGLSANLTGGVGPFTYQWYQDGEVLPGETEPAFQPVDSGLHTYNVRVRAAGCPDEVADGQATLLRVEAAPRFNGVATAVDRGETTCGIDLGWTEATSLCPGPISYAVYRAPGSSVTPDPGNLLTMLGAGSNGYSDSAGLIDGAEYAYLVRAIDGSTGQHDGNLAVASVAPLGPDVVAYFDDAGDTVAASLSPGAPWDVEPTGGHDGPGVYATGVYTNDLCADVRTAPIALNAGSTLSFWSRAEIESGWDKGVVEISTDAGANWSRVEVNYPGTSTRTTDECGLPTGSYFTGDSPTWAEYQADLSAWAGQAAMLRFELSTDGSVTDNGWWIDEITVFSASSCLTGAAGPAPAPDGRNGTDPLRGERLSVLGDSLQVTWDVATCTASDYNLLYGDLAHVSGYALDGSVCALGSGGSFEWNGVPAGDLFFLIVGTDGAGVESSWGQDGAGFERNGASVSGTCGTSEKDTTGVCP